MTGGVCVSLCRVKKLKETLVTVQQLDKNMSNLRTWLSRVEAELAEPVVYRVCHADEIQRKLTEQQVESQLPSRVPPQPVQVETFVVGAANKIERNFLKHKLGGRNAQRRLLGSASGQMVPSQTA